MNSSVGSAKSVDSSRLFQSLTLSQSWVGNCFCTPLSFQVQLQSCGVVSYELCFSVLVLVVFDGTWSDRPVSTTVIPQPPYPPPPPTPHPRRRRKRRRRRRRRRRRAFTSVFFRGRTVVTNGVYRDQDTATS